ncbi:MAG: hypothetical protein ACTHNS_09350 [Marmoricola sp.]
MNEHDQHDGQHDDQHVPPAVEPQVPPTPPSQDGTPTAETAAASPAATASWWGDRKRLAGAVAGVAVVAAVGVGGGYALGHNGGSSDVQVAGRFGNQLPGGFQGGPPNAEGGMQGMQGQGMQGQGMQGPMGGMDGEQHVTGTLTAVGDGTVTVKTTSGTQTYQVTAATQILQDGATVTLTELKTGSSVLVHVLPSGSGDGTAERVLAGTSATDGGFSPQAGQSPTTS